MYTVHVPNHPDYACTRHLGQPAIAANYRDQHVKAYLAKSSQYTSTGITLHRTWQLLLANTVPCPTVDLWVLEREK